MYPQGRMSHHFREMCVGDHLAVKGPKFEWAWQHPRACSTRSCCCFQVLLWTCTQDQACIHNANSSSLE
ncbi:hypothetical protein HID58_094972 [Brassica napus]|uniref:Flavoprotein pyridine nucleotide cytochrome reductase-like FAD-binding domain-containing protein n=1 Tax=Brassica napus TaxID=3708 RepID=A0ABQ7X7L6_BRANA|nr:hypothetical protein HID58_094972 [Brassica napus]